MRRTCSLALALAVVAAALCAPLSTAADVNINIGGPTLVVWPPPLILEKPKVIVVPETKVFTAPQLEFTVFVFGGKYYSHHNDAWFVAVRVGAPWTQIVLEKVPVEVRGVPVKYHKVPPGHAKKDKDDDHDRGHGHDKGRGR